MKRHTASWVRVVERAARLSQTGDMSGLGSLLTGAVRVALGLALLILLGFILNDCASTPPQQRVASFNIENFPKHGRQAQGAFAHIERLRAGAVGVQEIIAPERFRREARARLGPSWDFVWSSPISLQRVGVLYDTALFRLVEAREHRQTVTDRGARPALEAVLRPIGDGEGAPLLRVVVLHLKAGGDHAETRRRQLEALRPVLKELLATGDRVVLLGDFNSTGEQDRRLLARLSADLGMSWGSRGLACTSYWDRRDGCLGSPLDHVLSWEPPRRVYVGGACAEVGCEPGPSCPIYCEEVSDHCPVVIDLR
ncbi:MAG: hypothetical protein CMH57_15580 [Myxococcales bacterium]|nr:hypothetical protein [Myxococcales bacterium]